MRPCSPVARPQTHICEFSYKRRTISLPPSPPLSPLLLSTNSSTDLTTERTPLLDRKPRALHSSASSSITSSPRGLGFPPSRPSRTPLFLALSYASTSGTLSGMCLLFAKSGVELLLLTLGGSNQFWRWQAWVLLLGLVAFALLQLWYLHKALILADPTIVCPRAYLFSLGLEKSLADVSSRSGVLLLQPVFDRERPGVL